VATFDSPLFSVAKHLQNEGVLLIKICVSDFRISHWLIVICIKNWVRFAISTFFRPAWKAEKLIAEHLEMKPIGGFFPKAATPFPCIILDGARTGGGLFHGF
jgi:hypothetical protein